jgi:hypothetical protein
MDVEEYFLTLIKLKEEDIKKWDIDKFQGDTEKDKLKTFVSYRNSFMTKPQAKN